MIEGTMQRRTAQRTKRTRALVAVAALPVMLFAAACSSDSGSEKAASTAGGSSSGSAAPGEVTTAAPSPTLQAAVYASLPDACKTVTEKTLDSAVPKTKAAKKSTSDQTGTRSGCTWDSLSDNGVKGSQYRWLSVSLLRFDSNSAAGEADRQAQEYYTRQVKDAQATDGATNVKAAAGTGIGDTSTTIRYDQKKKEGSFKQQTVVTRAENVVITVDYNGAGFAGDSAPDADALVKVAEQAAKEAVAAVEKANGKAAAPSSPVPTTPSSPSSTPSAKPSSSPSASASAAKS